MLKSLKHKTLLLYSNYVSPNLIDCSEVRSANNSISFNYQIIRIGGPESYIHYHIRTYNDNY